jgi:hypothetical protein
MKDRFITVRTGKQETVSSDDGAKREKHGKARRWTSSVGWTIKKFGLDSPAGAENFLFFTTSKPILNTVDDRALFHRLNRSERESHLSRPSSVKVKNAWSFTSTPTLKRGGVSSLNMSNLAPAYILVILAGGVEWVL